MAAQKSNNPLPPPGYHCEKSAGESSVPQTNPGIKGGMGAGAKAIIGLGVGLGVATVVLLLVATIAMLGFMKSCDAFLSDSEETYDTAEVAAFISETKVTERDLETFDALRTSFEGLYLDRVEVVTTGSGAIDKRVLLRAQVFDQQRAAAAGYVDSFREKLESGEWPQDDPVLLAPDQDQSPQLWTRIAELSQDRIEKETGEQWRVLSFSYPYPTGGSDYIPFSSPKHRSTDRMITSLECVSGPDEGLCVDVVYRRWNDPADFYSGYEEARDSVRGDADTLAAFEASGLLEGRLYAFNQPVLYIWSTGEDDPLRDPETFAETLRALRDATGDPEFGLNLVLLEKDAPAILQRQFPTDDLVLSEQQVLAPAEAAGAIALDRCEADSFTFAAADELLKQSIFLRYAGKSSSLWLYDPSGYLVREQADSLHWSSEEEGRQGDAELAAFVGEQFGIDASQVIAVSLNSKDDIGEADESSTWTYHIAIPRGVLEESPKAVEDVTRDFARELWKYSFTNARPVAEYAVHLRLFVVDEPGMSGTNGAATFKEVRDAVMANPDAIRNYDVPTRLAVDFSGHDDGDRAHAAGDVWEYDFGLDVGGPVSESREWYLAKVEEGR